MRFLASGHFVMTRKKAGWDAMRHNEIFAAGSIPVFEATAGMPDETLFHHPKECFDEFRRASLGGGDPTATRDNAWRYFMDHLTCDAMTRFMMRAVGFDPCADGPLLFLDANAGDERCLQDPVWHGCQDYQSNLALVGLKEVMGPNMDVWKEPTYMYRYLVAVSTKPQFSKRNIESIDSLTFAELLFHALSIV